MYQNILFRIETAQEAEKEREAAMQAAANATNSADTT